jgi:Type II restriction endonuclease EcoO109I
MTATQTPEQIREGIKKYTKWWIGERKKKLLNELTHTMSINPFIAPFLYEFHDLKNFGDILDLLISSHLMIGHSTGFGKLVDEKILPNVFGTHKLDKKNRAGTPRFLESHFDEIDHVIFRPDGSKELLSLKAGRWTIQLTMATQLNRSFHEIVNRYGPDYKGIVVGVFYGHADTLTDKYDILRGINRGANHNVIDLTEHVSVYAGRAFWDWLSGVPNTQELVLKGIIEALREDSIRSESGGLLAGFKKAVGEFYGITDVDNSTPDWADLLNQINR